MAACVTLVSLMLSTSIPITIITLITTCNPTVFICHTRLPYKEVFTACVQARDDYNTPHLLHYPLQPQTYQQSPQ